MKYLIITILMLVSFCSRSNDKDELTVNKSKWDRKNISDYEFTLRINCFCPEERVGPHLIKVVNDQIVSVNNLPYDTGKTGELYTIDQLFSIIEKDIERDPYLKTMEYNSTFGYPQSVWFDFDKTMADEEIGYEVTDFKVI
jgi:hypothetical protein